MHCIQTCGYMLTRHPLGITPARDYPYTIDYCVAFKLHNIAHALAHKQIPTMLVVVLLFFSLDIYSKNANLIYNSTASYITTHLNSLINTAVFLIRRFLLKKGADKTTMTSDAERPIDLVDSQDFPMIAVMLQ